MPPSRFLPPPLAQQASFQPAMGNAISVIEHKWKTEGTKIFFPRLLGKIDDRASAKLLEIYMILDVVVGLSSLELLDDLPVSVATGNVEGGVSIPVLGIHKRLPVVPVQEKGHKVRVAPVTGVVQWSLKILHKKKNNPIKICVMILYTITLVACSSTKHKINVCKSVL